MITSLAKLFLVGGVLWQAAAAPRAPSLSPHVVKFLESCESSRRGMIAQLEFELRGLQNQGQRTPYDISRIEKLKTDLKALRAETLPVVPSLHFPLSVGAIGRVPRRMCHVDQIVSERELLIRCFFPVTVRVTRDRVESTTRTETLLLRGPVRPDAREGADLEMDGVFEVTGRYSYLTADGRASSVLVLQPFDLAAAEIYLKSRSQDGGGR